MVERALADNAVQAGPFCSSGWNAVLSDFLGSSAFSVNSLHVVLAAGSVACEAHRDNCRRH